MKMRGIDFTTYPVGDLERSVAFYKDVLGLKHSYTWGAFYAEFEVGDATFSVGVMPHLKPASGGGQVAFGVVSLAEAVAELKEKGLEPVSEIIETPVCRMASFLDPDGNSFLLHETPKV